MDLVNDSIWISDGIYSCLLKIAVIGQYKHGPTIFEKIYLYPCKMSFSFFCGCPKEDDKK